MKIHNLSCLFVAGALALASCSHDEYKGPDVEGSKLIVKGSVNGHISRAVNATWEPGDEIGISSDGGHDNVHFYTSKGDGLFESETPTYILGAGETSFTSYYPHHVEASATTPYLSFTEPKDFMFATAKASRENPVAEFKFNHVMSKISLKIADSNAVDGATGTIRLEGLAVSGTFHTLTGEVTANNATGTLTKTFAANSTVDFIVPPTGGSTGNATVVINYNGKVYGGTLSINSLEPGTEYQFSTELSSASEAGVLSISSATINDWNKTDGGSVDMEEKEPSREDNVLEVGDFLLSDGTTLDRYDSSFAKYKDQIVGVVFYVGNPQPSFINSKYDESIDVLKKDAPKAVNGLAVALKNANGNAAARFASAKYTFSDWSGAENYITTTLNLTKISTEFLGYNNTEVIKGATKDVGGSSASGETGCDALMSVLDEYNSTYSVTDASSWYVPSFGELNCIASEYSKISSAIQAAGGSLEQYNDFDASVNNNTGTFYWSSDLRGSTYTWVSPMVYQETAQAGLYPSRNTNSNQGYFRLVIAF